MLLVGSIFLCCPRKENFVPEKTVLNKKERFRVLIVPAVNEVYTDLMAQYQKVSKSIQSGNDNNKFEALRKKYKVSTNEELLMALKPSPQSITLAQAALESSWGTSRFCTEANNVFGVWSFNKNEPRIAAGRKRGNKTIWIKKYSSIKASIQDYYLTLARGSAFKKFRKQKMETDDPYTLVKDLNHYSEQGDEYGKLLSSIIRYNKFYIYDHRDMSKS
ncbi:MAG: hypothetical protein GY710_18645 [Desulfobacteraceae bacterium]|nr:hypothetical protein [Desulfobacteraceae bacterium]